MNAFPQQTWRIVLQRCGWIPEPSTAVAWLFLRGLGLIYLAAFGSMATQILGLIGTDGILPLDQALTGIAAEYPGQQYWRFPTLFWLSASDAMLQGVCYAGIIAALLLILNIFTRVALCACFLLYLSVTNAGQDFTSFQWDIFLLESGFLALFLTWHSKITIFLYRFLIARFMLMGGIVKISSGDPAWATLTALNYHYQTQPLPSPLAYYAYFLPEWWHQICVAAVLCIELLVPFCVFMPRPLRLFAAWSFIALQTGIILTGNYNFFNLLTLLLCLFLFEDRDILKRLPAQLRLQLHDRPAGFIATLCAAGWGTVVMTVLATHLWMAQTLRLPTQPFLTLIQTAAAFSVVNNYGPFSVMTKERNEIIVEGSEDGEHWLEYRFKYKPDAPDKALRWNIPHQPRLDWQLWFAALEKPRHGSWFENFMRRLQQGAPEVLALLAYNPFPEQPPGHLHALLYRYNYAAPEQRAATGNIWQRIALGVYWPSEAH